MLAAAVGLGCPAIGARQHVTARRPLARKQPLASPIAFAQLGGGASVPPTTSGRDTLDLGAASPAATPFAGSTLSSGASKQAGGADGWACPAGGGGDGGSSSGGGASGGGGSGSGGSGDEGEEEYLDLQAAEQVAAAKGVELPADYAAAASSGGLKASVLEGYCRLATGGALTSWLVKTVPAFRDRLILDRLFFFKVAAEVAIDSGCATVAEVRKRGDEFWSEFEFYLSDLCVGLVLDVVLVTLISPVARPGRPKPSTSALQQLLAGLPAAVFQRSPAGGKFTLLQRAGTFVKLGLEYSLAGIVCGFLGQGVANSMMLLKRHHYGEQEGDVAVPPLARTALVWGMFMGLSSNSRYQIVFGLERVVDETIARSIPSIAYFTTLAIRFANNVVGGENFIDMARWAGVQ